MRVFLCYLVSAAWTQLDLLQEIAGQILQELALSKWLQDRIDRARALAK